MADPTMDEIVEALEILARASRTQSASQASICAMLRQPHERITRLESILLLDQRRRFQLLAALAAEPGPSSQLH